MIMRDVIVFKYERKEGNAHFDKVDDGRGKFHCWGVNFEELRDGAGNYSTAIIERADGIVESVPAEMIQFIAADSINKL